MTRDAIPTFYAQPQVRRRVAEYLGAESKHPATCLYLAHPDSGWPRMQNIFRPDDVSRLLESERDLSRSLWDRESLIADLDIEYVNFDYPGESYLHPERSFRVQDPVRLAVENILSGYGIDALHQITGRGHHYVWRIPSQSGAFRQLRHLGRCNDTLINRYRWPDLPIAASVPPDHSLAFAGLGMVMEYVGLRIRTEAAKTSTLPVHLTDVTVGPGKRGREMVSIDISEYGDPLHLRVIRIPFTAYLKPAMEEAFQAEAGREALLSVAVPKDASPASVLAAMRDPEAASRLAEETTTRIPDSAPGTKRLVSDYRQSGLRAFHDAFFSQSQHPPERWGATYDMLNMHELPPCAAHILSFPNDLLMRPAAIELVVHVLLALGWHPRHIAGLIRSKYERDHAWGDQWLVHDAATRADFYTRIFASALAVGGDDLVDFNCTSVRKKGLCPEPRNGCGLVAMRTSLR